ncbi:hypothetical protein AArcSl_3076 [Halalkaliarchaeum desulfuricum]|uniref:Uncharacterized protein n=1 Tax=Halalkaliarchaeum desulfuricum TaxID=2055893 RepID=A0A343TNL1_9EURY|nr:hypothetical protein [Halalkaliarchaeum desulfuricum]AUX10683.1 hypothetical protein AArcSl_3076 [Halalkaliarchaeum desulfuricum]
MSEPLPTFASNRDRVVYLLAEYKIPLSIMTLAAGVWAIWATPQLPEPPEAVLAGSASAAMLAFPAFFLAKKVVKWLYAPEFVTVGVADPGDGEVYEKYNVPPDVWDDADVIGAQPLSPKEGVDYVVTRFNWMDDLGQLEVRGCDRADLTPAEAFATRKRVDEYYEHHHDLRRQFAGLKATVLGKATEVHDLTIMAMIAEREGAELAPGVGVDELVEDLEEAADEIPDAPASTEETSHVDRLDNQFAELDPGDVPGPDPAIADGGDQ